LNLSDDFAAFVETDDTRKGPPCSVCRLPGDLLEFVTTKFAEGTEGSKLGRFIRSKGHKVADSRVNYHFREKHDTRK
jgi:hypothetical protein